nr:uncharacterized protein LOC110440201 isoform X3 [Danio rerio]|eukprot:XP_021336763.1 uncharacterized protein LOC110440201 isoform X3 [Danio rerio]
MLELRKIMLVFGLLLLILQTAACVERFCSFTQSDPCYAALGHKLNLLMVDASKYTRTIKKIINNTEVAACKVRNDTMRANDCDLYINRPEVRIINGTVMINSVKREDSGDYKLVFDNSGGTEISQYLQVNVEAPVGSVKVSIICSSNQMRSVSCSSEGDQLLYSWTLNGETQTDGNSTIQLQEETKGEITCTVKNHVSQGNTTVSIKDCPVARYLLIAMGCVAVILILLFIIVYYVYRKKQHKSPTPAPPSGDVELIYTHISHQKTNKQGAGKKKEASPDDDVEYSAVRVQKKKKNKPEEEVQYGEVTFSPKHSNTQNQQQQQQQPAEECVYSEVHRS